MTFYNSLSFCMMTSFTEITAKEIMRLQPTSDYKKAWRVLVGIRDAVGVPTLLLCHLASYWKVPEESIIAQLRP
jgi:hypothetical protein